MGEAISTERDRKRNRSQDDENHNPKSLERESGAGRGVLKGETTTRPVVLVGQAPKSKGSPECGCSTLKRGY